MNFLQPKTEDPAVHVIQPLVNIRETDTEIVLEAEMVGLTKEDVNLELKDDELVITGKVRPYETPQGYTVIHRERCPYEYVRRFVLGETIDRARIDAQYENGILTVTLHKVEAVRPKRILIK
jgi:HSP20 family protein